MVTVGIDPHKKTHTAVIVGESGRQLGRALTITNGPDAVAKLTGWLAKHAAGAPARFVIEDGRGLARELATALVIAGYPVVWVPVRLVVAERRHGAQRGKSDPIDALACARAALNPDNARYLAAHRADEIGRDLRYLVDDRRTKITQRTSLINTLRWRLHELDPTLSPGSLTTLKGPRELAAALGTGPRSVLREILIRGCGDLLRLTGQINQLERDITAAITRICPTLLARPGVGPIVAATVIAELGDPTRVRTSAAFARLAGVAPIPVSTANTDHHRLDRGGNRRLNHSLHIVALTQARRHPPAQRLITKHQDKKGRKHGLRVLKRHLADAIYHDLITDLTPMTSQLAAA